MHFTIQNDNLRVTVDDLGAQLVSVWDKRYDTERIWDGGSRYWRDHAPLLFPYCGRLLDGKLTAQGKTYEGPIHGFARLMDFACVDKDEERLIFRLCDSDATRAYFPYPFELTLYVELFGNEVRLVAQVRNPGIPFSLADDILPYNLGFHPGFTLSPESTSFDYKLLFDVPESPLEIYTPHGLVNGSGRRRFSNQKIMPVRDAMFKDDSICLSGIESDAITLMNSKTGQAVRVGIGDFAYLVLWGPPKGPLPFLCIEPWDGLPDPDTPYGEFMDKPGVRHLHPGQAQSYETTFTFF